MNEKMHPAATREVTCLIRFEFVDRAVRASIYSCVESNEISRVLIADFERNDAHIAAQLRSTDAPVNENAAAHSHSDSGQICMMCDAVESD